MSIEVLHARAFSDNYIWLIAPDDKSPTGDRERPCIIVDPGDADAALRAIRQHRLQPVAIFCTHHHGDHVGGVGDILQAVDLPVYGPATESIRHITHPVQGGESIEIGSIGRFEVLSTPGHTPGHISFLGHGALFCGDTLFSGGCGRLLGGTATQLHGSLQRLAGLAPDIRVYCAHEYTLSNLAFAASAEPGNPEIERYRQWCQAQRGKRRPTLPSTIGRELQVNPFLRTGTPGVRASVASHTGKHLGTDLEVFTELRRWKDGFTG
jgi:hydroxyacylglutathione hydrolase